MARASGQVIGLARIRQLRAARVRAAAAWREHARTCGKCAPVPQLYAAACPVGHGLIGALQEALDAWADRERVPAVQAWQEGLW